MKSVHLDSIYRHYNFKWIVWGHRSITVVIFPHQFALTGWFEESGQFSSSSSWICQSIPYFLKCQGLWRHSYLVRWPRLCQLQVLGWMEIVWRRKTQNPKVTVTKSGSLEFPKLTSKRPWTKRIIVFPSCFFFPTQTLSHLDYNFFSYLRFKTDTQFSDNISAKTATHCYMLNPHATMVVKRAQVFNILEGRTKTSLSFLMIINTQMPLA